MMTMSKTAHHTLYKCPTRALPAPLQFGASSSESSHYPHKQIPHHLPQGSEGSRLGPQNLDFSISACPSGGSSGQILFT